MLCHVQRKSKALTAGKGVAATVSATSWLVPQHVKASKRLSSHLGGLWFLGLIQLSFWFPGHPQLFGGLVVLHLLCSKMFLWHSPDVHVLHLSLSSGGSSGSRILLWGLLRGLVSFRFMSDQANSPQTTVKVESHLKTDQETRKEPKAKV